MKYIYMFCVFLLVLLNALLSFAQPIKPYFTPNVFPKSPVAASIEKYGDYPVNQFSGVPEISIPLYEISAGGLKVPVSLSYHASGFRVNEKAGWAGLGWTVFAGGQMTRKVMGGIDEGPNGYLTGKLQQAANVNPETNTGIRYLAAVLMKEYDTQPDIFSYRFADKSGKFFFNGEDGYKIATVPYSPISIIPERSGQLYFTIKDEKGNNYSFGKTARENTSVSYAGQTLSNTSAWLLENIISQNNRDTVSFAYNIAANVEIPDYTHTWTVIDNIFNYDVSHPVYSPSSQTQSTIDNTSRISQQTIKEINYRNGKIVFESVTTPREDDIAGSNALRNIKIYKYDYATAQLLLQKSIQFYTGYFINGTDNMSKRLKLDSIAIFSGSGELMEKYRFEYKQDKVLPAYKSAAKDYWGYYNGKENSSLIPQMTVPYQLGSITIGSNIPNGREPDNECMQACILKKINYPTGGFTEFEFEANRYTEGGITKLAGGLRVRAIKSSSGYKSRPVIKTFTYLQARPNFIIKTHFFTMRHKGRVFILNIPNNYICPVLGGTRDITTYVSSPVIDIDAFDAVPVAYTSVSEYFGDGSNNTGRIDYEFSDRPDALQTASVAGTPVINSFFYERGNLLKKTMYKRIANNFQKVKEDIFKYSAFPEKHYNKVGFVVGKHTITDESYYGGGFTSDVNLGERNPSGACGAYHDSYSYNYAYYSISTDDNYPTSIITNLYDSEDATKFMTTTRSLFYDNFRHQQVSRIVTSDSKGNSTTEYNRYPADLLSETTQFTGNAAIDTMLSRNMQAVIIEKYINLTGTEGISGTLTKDAQLTSYKLLPNKVVVLDKHLELLLDDPINNFSKLSIVNGQFQPDIRYGQLAAMDIYDNNSNLLQYTSRNASPVSLIWDYSNKMAIAEIENANVSDVAYTSFEADGKGNWNFNGTPVADNQAATGRKVYNLASGNISAAGLNTANAHVVSYWSKSGSVTVNGTTGVKGATNNGWTYYEHKINAGISTIQVSGNAVMDELRLYPEKGSMTTYTYNPMVGILSSCSPSNIIIYYEYDSAGRLLSIKDAAGNIVQAQEYHHKN